MTAEDFTLYRARYLEWLAVMNYSARTVELRREVIGYFMAWCTERSLMQPQAITLPILERYQRHLYHYRKANGQPLTARVQRTRLSALRQFFKWLVRERYLLYNPASELLLPKVDHRLPQYVLTAHEAEGVLAQPDLNAPLGLRDRAILETLYSTGIRRLELINLGLHDLDNERGTLIVRQGKGRKDRVVPIGARACAWIEKYAQESRPGLCIDATDTHLFLTHLGSAFTPAHLTDLVRRYIARADIGKQGSCHLFRHTMATLMLENGADIRFIQAMLGHASIATTQTYTQVAIRQLQAIHAATHPGAHLGRASSGDDA